MLLAGCAGLSVSGSSTTPTTESPTETYTPGQPLTTVDSPGCGDEFEREPPTDPTAESAKEFALACETSRVVSPDGYATRDATVLGRTDAGVYVRAKVLVGTETGRTVGTYLVGNGTYRRIQERNAPLDGYYQSDDHRENAAQNAHLLNFGDRDRRLRLTLTYLNTSPPRTVFNRTYSLLAGSGVALRPVTMRVGTYNATVRADGELLAAREYSLTEKQTGALVVVITPDGDLAVLRMEMEAPA